MSSNLAESTAEVEVQARPTPAELASDEQDISMPLAAKALMDMARRRGLHASKHEAEQAWGQVTANTSRDRLIAAWKSLFKGHAVSTTRLDLLTSAQLPAWVMGYGGVGVVLRLPEGTSPAIIKWLGVEPLELPANPEVLVPTAPFVADAECSVDVPARKVATSAMIAALKAHKPMFLRIAIASIFINLIAILASLFVMQVYDRVVPNFAYATLWFLAAGMLLAYTFDAIFKLIRLKIMDATSKRLDEALSLYIFERLLGLKLDRRPTRQGSLVAQIRDYESVKSFFTSSTLFSIVDMPFIVLFILAIYLIAGPVAIVPAVLVIVNVVIGLVAYRPISRLQKENTDAIVRKQGMLYEAVSAGEIIKSQGGEARFSDLWLNATRESCDKNEELNYVSSAAQIANSFFQQLSYISIIIAGVYVIETGELTMGGLIACSILGGRALSTISNISPLLLRWHHSSYALKVLDSVLDSPSDESEQREANTQSLPLDITIEDIIYSYTGSQIPQFECPALTINAGERVAVVGKNGSGKSTLLKIIAGIATPNKGNIRVAGLDYEHCRQSWLRSVIGYLPQEPRLVSGTLLDNLTLGMSMPDEEKIVEALDKTGLLEAVQRHPMGLQLPISEGGAGMSGGQRQVVGLTRVLLQNPKIWLLDEPAANLDSELEKKLIDVISSLPADTTVIYTTHKQSWLSLADRALMVQNGEILADKEIIKNSTQASELGSNGVRGEHEPK
jgi:ATP-binding cassette subfamily C protein LapB